MRKLFLILLIILLLLPGISFAGREDIKLKINGEYITSDVSPFIHQDRTYVPVRFVGENLGMKVSYEYIDLGPGEDLFVTMKDPDGRIFELGIRGVYVDGINFNSDELLDSYITVKDRTFVPIRFVADALHMDVYWDQETRTVELVTNREPEEFRLMVKKGSDYDRLVLSPDYKILYNGSRYELYPTGKTLEEFYNEDIFLKMQQGIDVWDSIENLYGNNYFTMRRHEGYVEGFIAS